jgi:nitric oxide reductase subunit B
VIFILGGCVPFLYMAFLGLKHFRHGKTVMEMPQDVLFTEIESPTAKK